MTVYAVPLQAGGPQTLSVALAGVNYQLRVLYADAANDEGGWVLDVADQNGAPLVCGIPLVTGADLLEQYPHLGFGGKLFAATDGDLATPPTFDDLGVTSNLYFEA